MRISLLSSTLSLYRAVTAGFELSPASRKAAAIRPAPEQAARKLASLKGTGFSPYISDLE
jgi:hypothetical protein